MISGSPGIASPGQFSPGAIGYPVIAGVLLPAPFERTFAVPQNGLPWQGEKTQAELINFSFNWANEIGDDIIAASAWVLESTDLTNRQAAVDGTGAIATILLSGGVAANIYNVTNLITTESGLQSSATFRLLISAYNW